MPSPMYPQFVLLVALCSYQLSVECIQELCETDKLDGINANEAILDFMGQVEYFSNQTFAPINCLAVFIKRNWLLSPASCLIDSDNPQNYQIRFAKGKTVTVNKVGSPPWCFQSQSTHCAHIR